MNIYKHLRYTKNIKWFFILFAVFGIIILIDMRIRPLVKAMAANQAKLYATRAVNNAIADAVLEGKFPNNSIVDIYYSQLGEVSSISVDSASLNRIKANLTNAASHKIGELKEQKLSIPLGTLIGTPVLSGRGPRINFKILPAGSVKSKLIHHFDQAAINQTRHQIVLEIEARIIAILPGFSSRTEITTDVSIAETVIVGDIPQSFTQVLTPPDAEMDGIIADYGAQAEK